jgi:DNA-binding transcriptional MerR regulator
MTISEVSNKFNISQDTLRYYERIGLIPKIKKNKSGNRKYTEEDCKWIEFIKCMRSAGLPIEKLIEYIELFQIGDETIDARKKLLVEQRNILIEKINEMNDTLDKLNFKIEGYETGLFKAEKKLNNPK